MAAVDPALVPPDGEVSDAADVVRATLGRGLELAGTAVYHSCDSESAGGTV